MEIGDGAGDDPYGDGRLQTRAKHFILKHYLQALAYKVLRTWDLTYVDGFSGPWKTETEDFADTSFMIAIKALQQAQADLRAEGIHKQVRLFLCERDAEAFAQLQAAVTPYNRPAEGFEIQTYGGAFEDAVPRINALIGNSFPLIFIDPTGWTGFGFENIRSLFNRPKVEVLINFMYAFVSRFVQSDDPPTVASFERILGGPGWRDRLDPLLSPGLGAEKLFREALKDAGGFPFVLSTRIDKSAEESTHFFLVYGTKSPQGLKTFRDTEAKGLREHAKNRAHARDRREATRTGENSLFQGLSAEIKEDEMDRAVERNKRDATRDLLDTLKRDGAYRFDKVVEGLLQAYMLREMHIRDICVSLADGGKIENTWGKKPRKPKDGDIIRLIPTP